MLHGGLRRQPLSLQRQPIDPAGKAGARIGLPVVPSDGYHAVMACRFQPHRGGDVAVKLIPVDVAAHRQILRPLQFFQLQHR